MSKAVLRIPGPYRRPPRILTLALVTAAMVSCHGNSGRPKLFGIQLPTFSGTEDELTVRETRQIEVFGRMIRNPSADIDPHTRQQAAEELIAMDLQPATDTLVGALQSDEPVVVMSVIDAMEASPEPVEGLLPAATNTLLDADRDLLEKLSLLLPRYGPEALELVAQLAHDQTQPPARRIGPINALAAFRSRDSANRLMSLLEAMPPEPPGITAAAGESLERLTGVPYGSDVEKWRRWWNQLKDEPIEDWLQIMVSRLSTRTTELEQQVQHKNREIDEIATHLTKTLRELFLTLSTDEQLERLPKHLGSDLAAVREFALGRVERRLRDSERIPEPLQEKLAGRLNDRGELPTSRLLAARLLNDLNYEATSLLVAQALADQDDSVLVAGYLEILAKRPTPAALPQILFWLNDATAGEPAAAALWAIVTNRMIDDDALRATRKAVADALQWRTIPSLIRTLGAIGDSGDQADVEEWLDDPDPTLRRAAAEGLAFAGRRKPLLDRVLDEEIYPFVVRAVAQGQPDMDMLEELAQLAPPEAHRQEWARQLKVVADGLPPSDLLATDDELSNQPHADSALRAEILSRVPDLPAGTLPLDKRSALLLRLADLRIELGEYERAYQVLAWPNGAPTSSKFAETKFEATVLAGHYDEAAILNPQVQDWVTLLNRGAKLRPEIATAVADEIRRRFGQDLNGQAEEQLRAVEERLTAATAGAQTSTDGSTE